MVREIKKMVKFLMKLLIQEKVYNDGAENYGIRFSIHPDFNNKNKLLGFLQNSSEKIWLDGVINYSWEWEYNKVNGIQNGNIVLEEEPNSTGYTLDTNGQSSATKIISFLFDNIAEELDVEGEYFIDQDNMKLYFYPPTGWETQQLTITTLNDDLITIENANNITIKDLTLQSGRKNGININQSENIKVENNVIRYFNK